MGRGFLSWPHSRVSAEPRKKPSRKESQWLRWQEYTEELYRKDLEDPDNHDGVITHLEPDILECEVKWTLGSITTNKASGGDGIPVEILQTLKDDAVKVLHSIRYKFGKLSSGHRKRSVFILIPKKGSAKECSNYRTIALILHASKVMLKILQARLNSTWTMNFQMYKLDLEKAEGPEIKLPMFAGSWRKQGSSGKTSASLTMQKLLTLWITTNWKIFTCLLRNLYAGQNLTELDMKQQTSSKLRKEQDRILSSCLFNLYSEYIMWNAGWMTHKLESRLPGEISTASDMQVIPL